MTHAEKAKTSVCNIPHAHRRAGRYTFRRRVHFQNLISTPLSVALGTADPKVARVRASLLSARFMTVKVAVDDMLQSGPSLTGEQIEGIFRRALEGELSGLLRCLIPGFDGALFTSEWKDAL